MAHYLLSLLEKALASGGYAPRTPHQGAPPPEPPTRETPSTKLGKPCLDLYFFFPDTLLPHTFPPTRCLLNDFDRT